MLLMEENLWMENGENAEVYKYMESRICSLWPPIRPIELYKASTSCQGNGYRAVSSPAEANPEHHEGPHIINYTPCRLSAARFHAAPMGEVLVRNSSVLRKPTTSHIQNRHSSRNAPHQRPTSYDNTREQLCASRNACTKVLHEPPGVFAAQRNISGPLQNQF